MKDNKPLEFSLELEEVPVQIGGEPYVLRELDGRQRDKYLTKIAERVKGQGKDTKVSNFDGIQSALIAMSLHRCVGGGTEAVPEATIQGWPAKVVSALHDAAKDLSSLGGEDEKDDGGKD